MHKETSISLDDLTDTLKDIDRDLFINFRDKKVTYDQIKARLAERRYNIIYKCLDDLKPEIDPEFYTDL